MRSSRAALLTALAVDNLGSGLFLPVVLLYVTRVVGLPLGQAGSIVALGTAAGLAVPPLAGRLVDRGGPRPVVIAAELIQAVGAVTYLAARGPVAVGAAAVAIAAGQQMFYSSLFALLSDAAGDSAKDRPFAVAGMVRSGAFGLGALAAGGLLALAGAAAYRTAVIADAASFAGCALLLAVLVRAPRPRDPGGGPAATRRGAGRVRSDRPFLALIGAAGLAALAADFFLSGTSVYLLGELHTAPWLPGAALALCTGLAAVGGTAAVRLTRRLQRTTVMALGSGLYAVWCAASAAALAVPPAWRPAELLAASVLLAVAGLLFNSRVNALAVAAAPPGARGRYLAAFQYAFTVPGMAAPAVVALFPVASWLPWLLVGAAASLGVLLLRWLAAVLPAEVLRPAAGPAPAEPALHG